MSFPAPTSYTATMNPSGSFGQHPSSSILSARFPNGSKPGSGNHVSRTYKQSSTLFLTRRLPEALTTLAPLITPPAELQKDGGESGIDGMEDPAPVAVASRSTRVKVWSLYLTVLNAIVEMEPDEGKDSFGGEWRILCRKVREGDVWEKVVSSGYHGVEGDVDSEVVINLYVSLGQATHVGS